VAETTEPKVKTIATDTNVASVTFFEDRAEVVRTARVAVPAGRSRIHANGLTLLADDRTLACKAAVSREQDAVTIVWSRVRRRSEDSITASAEEIARIEEDLYGARARLTGVERATENAAADARRRDALMTMWAQSVRQVPSRADGAAAELARSYTTLDEGARRALDDLAALRTERSEARADLARAETRLALARAKKPRFEAFAEIEITSEKEDTLDLEIVYRTPCALWRPEHVARLTRREGALAGEIAITTYATVWQVTGETWKDIPCRFSTARPAQSASAPTLDDDVLSTRKKTAIERQQIVVEARDQAITTAGVARGTRDVDEMPGVDDGGEAQWLTGRANATIESDGRPVRIEIGERAFPCSVARVCYPELSPATHVRANATLPGPTPLLAGPVTLARETEVVGRSTVPFIGAGEPFELGFGVDDGVRVRRRVDKKRRTTPVTGTQRVECKVRLFVSDLGGSGRALTIIERIPVSEVEDVLIEVARHPEMHHDTRDGFATFEIEVPARATKELAFEYRIEAKSNVVLPPSLDA